MKLLGSALIFGASWLLPLGLSREKGHAARLMETFAQALEEMARLLEQCAPDMAELLRAGEIGEAAELFRSIDLTRLREMRFSDLWQEAIRRSDLSGISEAEKILLPLGDILGRYSREEQHRALLTAAEKLHSQSTALDNQRKTNGRLWYTLSVAGGAMVIILML